MGDGRGTGGVTIGVVVGPTGPARLVVPGMLGVLGASVEKSSGRVMPYCPAQVSAGRPLGQHRLLIRQKSPDRQISVAVSHTAPLPFH